MVIGNFFEKEKKAPTCRGPFYPPITALLLLSPFLNVSRPSINFFNYLECWRWLFAKSIVARKSLTDTFIIKF